MMIFKRVLGNVCRLIRRVCYLNWKRRGQTNYGRCCRWRLGWQHISKKMIRTSRGLSCICRQLAVCSICERNRLCPHDSSVVRKWGIWPVSSGFTSQFIWTGSVLPLISLPRGPLLKEARLYAVNYNTGMYVTYSVPVAMMMWNSHTGATGLKSIQNAQHAHVPYRMVKKYRVYFHV